MCQASKFSCVHILSLARARVMHKTPEMHAMNYICACFAKFIGMQILLRVITNTRAAHKLPKECY